MIKVKDENNEGHGSLEALIWTAAELKHYECTAQD